jgi:uncharacterized iron-regulated membrane protein
MNIIYQERKRFLAPRAWLLSLLLTLPLFTTGCGHNNANTPQANVNDRAGQVSPASVPSNSAAQDNKKGLSRGQKVAITLAGAAALYYLYKHHQNAKARTGAQGQYYLSRNGQVYYRDAQHRAHFVTPPSGGIQVPASEAQQYSQFQGYNNRPQGRSLVGLGNAPAY